MQIFPKERRESKYPCSVSKTRTTPFDVPKASRRRSEEKAAAKEEASSWPGSSQKNAEASTVDIDLSFRQSNGGDGAVVLEEGDAVSIL